MLSSILDSTHNVLIAGTAADIALEPLANLGLGWIGIVLEYLVRGHNHAGSTEATLQAMLFPETFLQRVQATLRSQSFDSSHFTAIRLHRQHRAGLDGLPI